MMKKFGILVALSVSACTTTAGVQSKDPTFSLASSKTAGALEECISLKLSRFGTPAAIRGENKTIFSYGQPNPAFTLTIVDLGSARSIEGRKGIISPNTVRSDIETCI